MKKIFLILLCVLFLAGCAQETTPENNNPKDSETVLFSGDNWEITKNQEIIDGVDTLAISYTEIIGERKVGFAILKQSANNNTMYKAMIMAARKSASFEPNFWDGYIISRGQSSVLMSNAISSPVNGDDGWFSFMIMGGLNHSSIVSLMESTTISISLISSEDETQNSMFTLPMSFQTAMINNL